MASGAFRLERKMLPSLTQSVGVFFGFPGPSLICRLSKTIKRRSFMSCISQVAHVITYVRLLIKNIKSRNDRNAGDVDLIFFDSQFQ
jgi:hypothetical protein